MDTVRRALARGLFMTGDGHYASLDTGHQCYIHPQSVSGQSSSIRSRRRVMVHTSRTYDYWMNPRVVTNSIQKKSVKRQNLLSEWQ